MRLRQLHGQQQRQVGKEPHALQRQQLRQRQANRTRSPPVALAFPRPPMTEAELQEQVRVMCKQLGLYHYHPYDSRRSEAGWTDSSILGIGKHLFAELKVGRNKRSPAQAEVAYRMQAAGLHYELWTEHDLAAGRIQRTLAGLAGLKVAR